MHTTTPPPAKPPQGSADDVYRARLAPLIPADVPSFTVHVSDRRKRTSVRVDVGGTLAFLVPAGIDPDRLAAIAGRLIRAAMPRVRHMADRGVHVPVKELVNGEGFKFGGRNYRVQITDQPGADAYTWGDGPSTWSGVRTFRLTLRRDARTAATVVDWYREIGRAMLDRELPMMSREMAVPDVDRLTWEVLKFRPSTAGKLPTRWAYYRPGEHRIYVHWVAFQFPTELLRHILRHEVAHAKHRGANDGDGPHGRRWRTTMELHSSRPWKDLEAAVKSADGLTLWAGGVSTPRPDPERPVTTRRPRRAVKPVADASGDTPQRGHADGVAWAATRTPAELAQAVTAREGTGYADGGYNGAFTAALRSAIASPWTATAGALAGA